MGEGAKDVSTAAEALVERLQQYGVRHIFGQSIPTRIHLAARSRGIRQIGYRTENAGGAMADGFARVSRRVSVITAQNGPAATLLVPALAEAMKASVPVVALVQDVPKNKTDKNAFQEYDHLSLFHSCTKWVRRVTEPGRIVDYIDMAFRAAATGRCGPAVLLLPMDMLGEPAGGGKPSVGDDTFPLDRALADPGNIATAVELLAAADNPVIVAGGGIHLSGAAGVLAGLQEEYGIPVATTNMGKGAVSELHPLSLGVVGNCTGRPSLGHYSRSTIESADVVMLVGTRTNENGTDEWQLFRSDPTFIHIDVDGMEVGRIMPFDWWEMRSSRSLPSPTDWARAILKCGERGRRVCARAWRRDGQPAGRTRAPPPSCRPTHTAGISLPAAGCCPDGRSDRGC